MQKKGQAIVDYLIMLILALILAMVAISFLLFVPEFGQDIKMKHSQDYWKNYARPFSIEDVYYKTSNNRLYLALVSHLDDDATLRGIFIADKQLSYSNYDENALDKIGDILCSLPSCTYIPCDCIMQIKKHASKSIVLEPYLDAQEVCGTNLRAGELNITIIYSRTTENDLNLSETSNLPLAFFCQ